MEIEKVNKLMEEGLSCGQVVLRYFEDKINLDRKVLEKLSAGFEAGGFNGGKCGALLGAYTVLGLLKYNFDDESKVEMIKCIYSLNENFKKEFKTDICEQMLGKNPSTEIGLKEAMSEGKFKALVLEPLLLLLRRLKNAFNSWFW